MVMKYKAIRRVAAAGLCAFAASCSVSCSDPVRDRRIGELGGEDPSVPTGPLHRPGQPCVLCHSAGGPASKAPFAIAGTIFDTNGAAANGAEGVQVLFIDADSSKRRADTNAAGNFYIKESEWSDLAFPFKVGLLSKDGKQVPMNSTVNREGSCNFCHRPVAGSKRSLPTDDPRSSIPQIFVAAQAAGKP
jgi:hypothetical protein